MTSHIGNYSVRSMTSRSANISLRSMTSHSGNDSLLWMTTQGANDSLRGMTSQRGNYSLREMMVYASVMLAISIWVVCSNILVLLAIRRTPRLQNKTGIFIASLAVADLLCGLFLMPSWLLGSFLLPKHGAYYLCGFYISIQVLPLLASITNLVLIGLERYLAIVHPLKSRGFLSRKRCYQMVIGAWIIPAILSFIIIPWNGFTSGKHRVCSARHMDKIYFFTVVYISFWGLLLLLIYLYVAIIRTVCGHHKFVRQHSIDTSQEKLRHERRKYRSDLKLAKMIMLVLGVFCVCWIPRILSLTLHYIDPGRSHLTFLVVSGIIAFLNSGMNMILYAARNKHYCHAFKNIILCRKQSTTPEVWSSQDSTSQKGRFRFYQNGSSSSLKALGNLYNNGSSSSLKALGTLVGNTTTTSSVLAPHNFILNDSTSSLRAVGCSDDGGSVAPSFPGSRAGSEGNLNALKKTVRFSGDMATMLSLTAAAERKESSTSLSQNEGITFNVDSKTKRNSDTCLLKVNLKTNTQSDC